MEKKNMDHIPNRFIQIKNTLKAVEHLKIHSMCSLEIDNKWLTQTENESCIDDFDIRDLLSKQIHDLYDVINALSLKLYYVKSGSTGHTFHAYNPNNKISFAIKVVAYSKHKMYGNMYDIKRPENAELLLLKHLSAFVGSSQTPHLVLPVCSFYTSIRPFINIYKNNYVDHKRYGEFVEKYNNGEYYDKVSVLISEWINGGDFLDYIRKFYRSMTLQTWKVFFFQILSTLAVIFNKYPSFRHNDMKANNILVQNTDIDIKTFQYTINEQKYSCPNTNIQVRLWDFDFACIPNLIDNNKVNAKWTNKINVKAERNQYYDIHYFFNTLYKKGFFPEFLTSRKIPDEIRNFVKRIIPEKYSKKPNVTENGRLFVNIEFMTPDYILKNDPLFEEFRISSKL